LKLEENILAEKTGLWFLRYEERCVSGLGLIVFTTSLFLLSFFENSDYLSEEFITKS